MKLLNNNQLENCKNKITRQLNAVPFNTLFAQNVVNKKINQSRLLKMTSE